MATIFSKIVKGEVPSYKIAEDDHFFAFLDIYPLAKGHTLVIPKQETDYIFDLKDDMLSGLSLFAKRVAKAIEQVVECRRIGVAVVGLDVPHVHIHLIPLQKIDDLNFANPKLKLSSEEFEEIAAKIQEKFQ